jgi:hypothetical protein
MRVHARWAVSTLIVAFPVFLFLSSATERGIRLDPAKRQSNVRRWLMYLTVFAAAAVLIGDVITLVYNALGGELTTRFVLKVATIGTIAGTVLGYYLSDLRLEDRTSPVERSPWRRAIAAASLAGIAVVVGTGLLVIGSPSSERGRRLDERRIRDLREITRSVGVYFERRRQLPASLGELSGEAGIRIADKDPSGAPYEYEITGSETFRLCATFQRSSAERGRGTGFWSHDPGRQCFQIAATTDRKASSYQE